MKKLTLPFCVLCALCLAPPVLAEADTEATAEAASEALEILKKVDAAIKAVDSVRFKATTKATGTATAFMSDAEGETVMMGWTGSLPAKFYARVKTAKPGSDAAVELEGGGDGESFFVVDHGTRKGYEDMDPAVFGSTGNTLRGVGMMEYVHPTPFDDEINAEKAELLESVIVGGEDCHQIHVVYSGGLGESTWFFSKQDFLPRRRIRHFEIPDRGNGSFEITLTEVEVAPEVDPALFKMKLPEGYEQVDDFAP